MGPGTAVEELLTSDENIHETGGEEKMQKKKGKRNKIKKQETQAIKCLEMRAKVKSVRKINEIFLCIFTYI